IGTSRAHEFSLRLSALLVFCHFFVLNRSPPPRATLFPYTTLFRSMYMPNVAAALISMRYRAKGPNYCTVSACASTPSSNSAPWRSEEHTSELQSRGHLVCRLLLEKKKQTSRPSSLLLKDIVVAYIK